MNKYQEFAIKLLRVVSNKSESSNLPASIEWDYKKITITQNENYNVTKYEVLLQTPSISKIEYSLNGKTCLVERVDEAQHLITLDFNKKIKGLLVYFVNDVVEPLIVPIEFVDADKTKYDEKIALENQKRLNQIANVKVTTSDTLINVTFQPVTKNFGYSKVELYTKEKQLMGKYKTEEDIYFKSINGLAYDSYFIKLVQYNINGEIIYSSDLISVTLSRPDYSGGTVNY